MHDKKLAGEFVLRCFHARTAAHVLHLQTRSYEEHKALNDFYEEIVPLADSFAETFQGLHGLIEFPPVSYANADTKAVELMAYLQAWISQQRKTICADSCCQNLIDEICALVASTTYKLKFLK